MHKFSSQYESEKVQQNQRVSPYNSFTKTASKAIKMRGERSAKKNMVRINDAEIENELLKQIEKAEEVVNSFSSNIVEISKQYPKNSLEQLRAMEDMIQQKDLVIREIEEEIKVLKAGRYVFGEDTHDPEKESHNLLRLSNQIKNEKEELINLQKIYMQRKKQIEKKREQIVQAERKYNQTCQEQGTKFISFEQFKKLYKAKKKEQTLGKTRKKQKNNISYIKEVMKQKTAANSQGQNKKIKELIMKKNVTETALKTAKKKHQIQLNDLIGKLEFLKDENQDLEEKLLLKEQELKTAENKFSQTRNSAEKKCITSRRLRTDY